MREAYNDIINLIKSQTTTPTTGVIINVEMLKDFTMYSGTNLKTAHVTGPFPVSPVPAVAGEVAHRYRL